MELSTLANLAEIISAVAVVVTLIYLSTQIKQAKEQIAIAGRQARADAARDVLGSVSETEYLAPIFAKLDDFPWGDFGLESKEETARFGAWCHAWMRTEEHNFQALPASSRASQDKLLLMWLSTSWGASFWDQSKAIYDEEFAAYVASLRNRLRESPKSTEELLREREGQRGTSRDA